MGRDFAPILTMLLGAVLIAGGVVSADSVGTLGGAFVYMAGLHWPPRAPRIQNTPASEEGRGVWP